MIKTFLLDLWWSCRNISPVWKCVLLSCQELDEKFNLSLVCVLLCSWSEEVIGLAFFKIQAKMGTYHLRKSVHERNYSSMPLPVSVTIWILFEEWIAQTKTCWLTYFSSAPACSLYALLTWTSPNSEFTANVQTRECYRLYHPTHGNIARVFL